MRLVYSTRYHTDQYGCFRRMVGPGIKLPGKCSGVFKTMFETIVGEYVAKGQGPLGKLNNCHALCTL